MWLSLLAFIVPLKCCCMIPQGDAHQVWTPGSSQAPVLTDPYSHQLWALVSPSMPCPLPAPSLAQLMNSPCFMFALASLYD